jgi:hypothetical protein
MEYGMRSITEVPVECPKCEWKATVGDCSIGEDEELVCPECLSPVNVHTTEFEDHPERLN